MYNVKDQYLVLEIPKNGSRSLVQACCDHHGKKWMKCHGHHTLKEFVDVMQWRDLNDSSRPTGMLPVYAVLRHPEERLVSQLRQADRKKIGKSLDYWMQVALDQSDIVFKPQYKFLEAPLPRDLKFDLRIWPIEKIFFATAFITNKNILYNKNRFRGGSSIDRAMVRASKRYNDVLYGVYGKDFNLYERSKRAYEDGTHHNIQLLES